MKVDLNKLEFGLNTFGDLAYHDDRDELIGYQESLQMLVKEAILADELNIDILALGEHHRKEYSVSSPDTVLAAISQVTKKIKLGTAVTVLSSDDPIRVYERFATLDGLSGGRAQLMLGRGSFTESFPLFGYDLKDYHELFEEKIALLAQLLENKPVTWQGKFTQSLNNVQVYPKLDHKLDVQVGVGGSPDSIIRAAKYGFPVMLAIIGGEPTRFKPYIELYHRAAMEFKQPLHPVGMHSHGVICETDQEAFAIANKYLRGAMNQIGKERGWAPMTQERFEYEVKYGAYYVGSVETVAQKIAKMIEAVGVQRFDLIYGIGGHKQKDRFKTIELYGKYVIPRVKEILKGSVKNG